MRAPTTVYEHIDATRVRVHGPRGEEPMAVWDRRICALMVDGRPLGDHHLPRHKEGTKRINEMMGIVGALVGANVDGDICELRSLAPRPGLATPDFEADLMDGRAVRLETCALVDETQQRYVNAAGAIMQRVNSVIAAAPPVWAASPYYVRCYARRLAPTDIGPVSRELVAFLTKNGPALPVTASMTKIGAPYGALERLGTHVCRLEREGETGLMLEPLLHLLGDVRPREPFPRLFAQKAAKYDEYSDAGAIPVWLAMYVLSPMTLPHGDVATLLAAAPDPRPFDRLIIGSKTIGGAFGPLGLSDVTAT
jgi:hypothetical protein